MDSLEQGNQPFPRRVRVTGPWLVVPQQLMPCVLQGGFEDIVFSRSAVERSRANRHEGLRALLPIPLFANWIPKRMQSLLRLEKKN